MLLLNMKLARRVTACRPRVPPGRQARRSRRKGRSDSPSKVTGSAPLVGTTIPKRNGEYMASKKQIAQPEGAPKFAARVWHWRAKKYLYAKDYNIKGFPLG